MTKVFVSYSHKQGEWVWDRLVPCLKAGCAKVLIDRERFEVGKSVVGQMDSVQDQAEKHLLVLSPDYLASQYCKHEMNRAIDTDPDFAEGRVLPIVRQDCKLPNRLASRSTKKPAPLYVNLADDTNDDDWDQLLGACDADLGVAAPHWLSVRDELRRDLEHGRSVNLVVSGKDVAWRPLIDHLAADPTTRMTRVDLYSAQTIERPELLASMLSEDEGAHNLPPVPRDLGEFQRELVSRPTPSRVALMHFDQVQHREYGVDYFTTLRHLVTEERKLVLLVQSRATFDRLLQPEERSILSQFLLQSVELKGRE